jgi:hypothetical protein
MMNKSFSFLFFKKELRAGLVGLPRAKKESASFCKKKQKLSFEVCDGR